MKRGLQNNWFSLSVNATAETSFHYYYCLSNRWVSECKSANSTFQEILTFDVKPRGSGGLHHFASQAKPTSLYAPSSAYYPTLDTHTHTHTTSLWQKLYGPCQVTWSKQLFTTPLLGWGITLSGADEDRAASLKLNLFTHCQSDMKREIGTKPWLLACLLLLLCTGFK